MTCIDRLSGVIRMAERHHGVVTRDQALGLGATDKVLAGMVRRGMLERRHAGVYLLAGTPPSPLTLVRAALAAVGGDAMASHGSAAWLAGLVERPPGRVEVTATTTHPLGLRGVRVHRSARPPKVRSFQGVRCTDVPRTLVDLASTAGPEQLALAVDRALAARVTRPRDLLRELGAGRRPGNPALRACLGERGDFCVPDASVLEARMGRLLVRYEVPVPRAEVHAGRDGRYRIDYAYPERRVAVELYGFAWHHSPEQMSRDLARQRALVLQGWRVLVYTWWDVVHDGRRVVAEIRAAIGG